MKKLLIICLSSISFSCNKNPTVIDIQKTPIESTRSVASTPQFWYRIKNIYPHDRSAFTQGLVFANGTLYEGTGRWGYSSLRRVDLPTGAVLQQYNLNSQYFGEGITVHGDSIVQLTYRAGIGFIYERYSFIQIGQFSYPTEGWGITQDGSRFIMSDGSSTLYFRDFQTFDVIGHITVYDDHGPVSRLNELEYINGQVYANVWLTDDIVSINPLTGQVTARIDFSGLLTPEDQNPPVDVLNGIAYDWELDRIYITGKYWPKLFFIELLTNVEYQFPQPGMYLVSLPVQCDDMNAYNLFPLLNENGVFEWDAVDQKYINVAELTVGEAYWFSIKSPGSVTITGVPVDIIKTDLSSGWNLVGIPYLNDFDSETDPPNAIVSGFIGYDPFTGVYLYAQQPQITKGYWVAAKQNCTLTIKFPTEPLGRIVKSLTNQSFSHPPLSPGNQNTPF
ncbi:glutaminyl-peptide cyclotransferase [candidate division KSB1 bacterium]|nr:glutaminyl-peptide cyclotransferase [candidate division KSB1 bacterium]